MALPCRAVLLLVLQYSCIATIWAQVPNFSITPLRVSLTESSPEVEVCIISETSLARDVVVTAETGPKSGATAQATADSDYRTTTVILTFTPSDVSILSQCITIPIINDDVANEPDEQFSVTLISAFPEGTFGEDTTCVTIIDDDHDVIMDYFEITYFDERDPITSVRMENANYNSSSLDQPGFSTTLSSTGGHTFSIIAVYGVPRLRSSPAIVTGVRILEEGMTLMPNAIVANTTVGDTLTVSWPPAENLNYLRGYRVFFTATSLVTPSSGRHRQTTSSVNVGPDQTSTQIDFQPFSTYMVNVSAEYNAPPNGGEVLVDLLPTTTFMTPQRPPGAPTLVSLRVVDIVKVELTWTAPNDWNGIITGYNIYFHTLGGVEQSIGIEGATVTSHNTAQLSPDTTYVFEVAAINGAGVGDRSKTMQIKTDFDGINATPFNIAVAVAPIAAIAVIFPIILVIYPHLLRPVMIIQAYARSGNTRRGLLAPHCQKGHEDQAKGASSVSVVDTPAKVKYN